MSNRKRMKLCANCDGLVDLDVIVCPYCGSDVTQAVSAQKIEKPAVDNRKNLTLEQTLSSLYPPPYQPKSIDSNSLDPNEIDPSDIEMPKVKEKAIDNSKNLKKDSFEKLSLVMPTVLFSLGINICLFGLYLLLFSKNGELFIHFKSALWFLYILIGAPLTYMGYKLLNKYSFFKDK